MPGNGTGGTIGTAPPLDGEAREIVRNPDTADREACEWALARLTELAGRGSCRAAFHAARLRLLSPSPENLQEAERLTGRLAAQRTGPAKAAAAGCLRRAAGEQAIGCTLALLRKGVRLGEPAAARMLCGDLLAGKVRLEKQELRRLALALKESAEKGKWLS